MKADRVLASADLNTRRAYELRAARSEPGLEPAAESLQLEQASDGPQPVTSAVEPEVAQPSGE